MGVNAMREYTLYLESGPRQRKTMVHMPEILGCIAQGATVEEALEATPQSIRAYLHFLKRHGVAVDPDAAFSTTIAEHVMEGHWLGNGDPTPGFKPDFQPVTADEVETYLCRGDWMLEELLAAVSRLTPEQIAAEPEGSGRSISRILEHVAESQCVYLRMAIGKVEGLHEALHAAIADPHGLRGLWDVTRHRWEGLSAVEREAQVPHGQVTWTARRGLRRTLEHEWEHLLEIESRI
jgi:predicted RNase H-like HicB family nuclease/uncharacterized damage-inducible protein DinB